VHLQASGNPQLKIAKRGDTNVFYVSNRFKDYDAVDIVLDTLNLAKGNKYEITIIGRVDGKPPEGALVLLQSTPGFSWLCSKFMAEDGEFNLTYTLTPSGIEKWSSVRISTNSIGASVSFYIYSIEVESLGVF
jgi:hypothetical protein